MASLGGVTSLWVNWQTKNKTVFDRNERNEETNMCGIAGLIHRGKSDNIGEQLTAMLQSLKHRGPDSTGFALYGNADTDQYVMRFKVAEQEESKKGFDIQGQMKERKALVEAR